MRLGKAASILAALTDQHDSKTAHISCSTDRHILQNGDNQTLLHPESLGKVGRLKQKFDRKTEKDVDFGGAEKPRGKVRSLLAAKLDGDTSDSHNARTKSQTLLVDQPSTSDVIVNGLEATKERLLKNPRLSEDRRPLLNQRDDSEANRSCQEADCRDVEEGCSSFHPLENPSLLQRPSLSHNESLSRSQGSLSAANEPRHKLRTLHSLEEEGTREDRVKPNTHQVAEGFGECSEGGRSHRHKSGTSSFEERDTRRHSQVNESDSWPNVGYAEHIEPEGPSGAASQESANVERLYLKNPRQLNRLKDLQRRASVQPVVFKSRERSLPRIQHQRHSSGHSVPGPKLRVEGVGACSVSFELEAEEGRRLLSAPYLDNFYAEQPWDASARKHSRFRRCPRPASLRHADNGPTDASELAYNSAVAEPCAPAASAPDKPALGLARLAENLAVAVCTPLLDEPRSDAEPLQSPNGQVGLSQPEMDSRRPLLKPVASESLLVQADLPSAPPPPLPTPAPETPSFTSSFVEKFERNHRFLRSRMGSKRVRNRLVQKHGFVNISLANIPKQHRKYFRDIFTTIIEIKWRWCLIFFSLSFILSWSMFTGIYYLLALYHGDFEHRNDPGWQPCIMNGDSVLNLFLFAFTTQTTIGYGFRYPTDACTLTVMTMCVQFMVGVMCQTLMAGVIFAKLARPIKRAATILFSKNAVICMRDGKLCLLFRVGDMRKSSLAEAHVRLQMVEPLQEAFQMIKKCVTMEGEVLPFHQFDMNVGYDTGLDRVFVIWPITICHEIDESSPLYEMSKRGLQGAHFEIIAILEGVVESVGSTTQARTSYLPNEILWGKRFEKLVTYQRENGEYKIDFGKFHNVYDVDTPECSAKELDEQNVQMRSRHSSDAGIVLMRKASTDSSCGFARPTPRPIDRMHVPTVSLPDVGRFQQRVLLESAEEEAEAAEAAQAAHDAYRRRRSFLTVPGDGHLNFLSSENHRKQSIQVRRGPDLF